MAPNGNIISNRITGQDIKFIQSAANTNGKLLEMESTFRPNSKEPVSHFHPSQAEDFVVLDGELSVRIDGQVRVLQKGQNLHIPAKKTHSMWNNSTNKTVVNWKISPAGEFEYFLRIATGLANDGKTNSEGVPHLFYVALLANRYSKVYRVAKPPFLVQKIVFTILTPLAWLLGYRINQKKYDQ